MPTLNIVANKRDTLILAEELLRLGERRATSWVARGREHAEDLPSNSRGKQGQGICFHGKNDGTKRLHNGELGGHMRRFLDGLHKIATQRPGENRLSLFRRFAIHVH
jgi:hypothetical protein